MDVRQVLTSSVIILWIVLPCLGLLIQYAIIRLAVSRGMRDHQLWMEKNRPSGGLPITGRRPIGQYRDPAAPPDTVT